MGLYKRCDDKFKARDRCPHEWYGRYQYKGRLYRVSLNRFANSETLTKSQAQMAYEKLKAQIRDGRFRSEDHAQIGALTFIQLSDRYMEKHVRGEQLRSADRIAYSIETLNRYFGSTP